MYELVQAGENTFYVQSPAKIGLVRCGGSDVCLIDSGSDKDAARKVRQHLDAHGWHLNAIYCTHSHADHIGGCAYLQKQTGCRVYAPGIDCAFTRHPVLEPALLYGGFPPKELRHKFLMACSSDAEYLTPEALPSGLTAIPLPGHCFDMVGYRTPDDVVFLADCLSSLETLEKYPVGYLYDAAAYLQTLETVKTLHAKLFVPAHAEAAENIAPLAQANIDKVRQIGDRLVSLCAQPRGTEELLQLVFTQYGIPMSFPQYALVGSTVRSYLTWLKDLGRVEVRLEANRLLWVSTETTA